MKKFKWLLIVLLFVLFLAQPILILNRAETLNKLIIQDMDAVEKQVAELEKQVAESQKQNAELQRQVAELQKGNIAFKQVKDLIKQVTNLLELKLSWEERNGLLRNFGNRKRCNY